MTEDGNEGFREGSYYQIGRLKHKLESSGIKTQGHAVCFSAFKPGAPLESRIHLPHRRPHAAKCLRSAERPVSHPKRPWSLATAARGRACGRSKRRGVAEAD